MAKKLKKELPAWLKKTAAIIGILGAFVTVFTGLSALILQIKDVNVEIEKERTKQHQAILASSEAQLQQKRIELEISKQNIEIEIEKTKQKEAERKRVQLELEKQRNEINNAEEARIKAENMQKEKQVLESISTVVDNEKASLGALLILIEHIDQNLEYQDLIITALVSKAEDTESIAEVRLIFKLLHKAGVNAFDSVVQINRIALDQFRRNLIILFWSRAKKSLTTSLSNYFQENRIISLSELFEYYSSNVIEPIIYQTSQKILSIDPQFQWLIMVENWTKFEQQSASFRAPSGQVIDELKKAFQQIAELYSVEDLETVGKKLLVKGEIINSSRYFIEQYLPALTKVPRMKSVINLSETYLVGIKVNIAELDNYLVKLKNALFRPGENIVYANAGPPSANVRDAISLKNELSLKEAQEELEYRLQKMQRFMTLSVTRKGAK